MAGTVLVVEDDDTIRVLMREVLTQQGHRVLESSDGSDAVAIAQCERADVVLLDLGLPGRDGFCVLADLQRELPEVPVLIVTAWDDTPSMTRALDGGAHDYLRKPFPRTELVARVEAALRVKATTDALAGIQVQLVELAHLDPLTGLPNRRRLEIALGEAMTAGPAAIILADVDHFSAINNADGHHAGDDALEAIARRLSAHVRGDAVVGRWGGEEFLVVLPGGTLGSAGALAEDLRQAVAAAPVAGYHVTISLGVAAKLGREPGAAMVARADAALYAAKRSGRNAVYSSAWSSSLAMPATGMATQSGRLLSS